MGIWQAIAAFWKDDTIRTLIVAVGSGVGGWFLNALNAWWQGRERYQVHITWQSFDTMYGEQDYPALIVENIHTKPINITHVRVRNGFRWKLENYPFESDDPDYPTMPIRIESGNNKSLPLSLDVLEKATNQSWLLNWFYVPRAYIGLKTMGRGERVFSAEGGLPWDKRRGRFRR